MRLWVNVHPSHDAFFTPNSTDWTKRIQSKAKKKFFEKGRAPKIVLASAGWRFPFKTFAQVWRPSVRTRLQYIITRLWSDFERREKICRVIEHSKVVGMKGWLDWKLLRKHFLETKSSLRFAPPKVKNESRWRRFRRPIILSASQRFVNKGTNDDDDTWSIIFSRRRSCRR